MLTYAIGFIQNTQIASFFLIFVLMAIKDRTNRSIRWLAYTYTAGLMACLLQFASPYLPTWASTGLSMVAAPIGFACIHACIVDFVGRGRNTRWIPVAFVVVSLPFCLLWSDPAHYGRILTIIDFVLTLVPPLTAWLLLTARDSETLWPRRTLAAFLLLYAAVECSRVIVYVATGKTADLSAPWIEIASGMVYVISCSVLPLAIIWMMNARLHAHMERQMISDPLTQLLNRRGLQNAGEVELARYRRSNQDFAVVVMDIDHFKRLNDTFGHPGGDTVLCAISALLRSQLRTSDTIGRLGGEEFVLMLPSISSGKAKQLVERIRLAIESHSFPIGNAHANITSSFGITVSDGRKDLTWQTLLNEADVALYAAKRAGRNLSLFYQEDLTSSQETLPAPTHSGQLPNVDTPLASLPLPSSPPMIQASRHEPPSTL
jgi:diguanylate cyclase (GGDEF)-like protein